jgi:hypothetical protein
MKPKIQKVGLIQVDGVMPNLALMKMHRWAREKGMNPVYIDLSTLGVDQWFGSKVFMGGSGYDLKGTLPQDIEELTPDYEAFNLDHDVVFTSRGCIRNCKDFCIVREKEGGIHEIENWQKDIKHSQVIVMDNNFLASPLWKEKLWYFIDNEIKVNFNQGLDIRLIDDEKAAMLSMVNYYDLSFKNHRLYFAFDNINLESIFREKLALLLQYIKNPKHIMVYMLIGGKGQTFEDAMARYKIIKSFGCMPFPMKFHNNDKKLNDFARWVIRRYDEVVPNFEDYDPKKHR